MEASVPPSAAASARSTTVADVLAHAVERHGERIAVRHRRDGAWRAVTFAEVGATVDRLSLGLIDLGIARGDRVALLARTRPAWTHVDLAATQIGAVLVPIDPTSPPQACAAALADADAVAIVCEDAAQLAKVAQVRDRLPRLRRVIALDGDEGALRAAVADTIGLERLCARGHTHVPAEIARRRDELRPDDPCTLLPASGATSPRVLTHRACRALLDALAQARPIDRDAVTCLALPLAHPYARLVQLRSLEVGACLAYGADADEPCAELGGSRATVLSAAPDDVDRLLARADRSVDGSRPRAATSGGAGRPS